MKRDMTIGLVLSLFTALILNGYSVAQAQTVNVSGQLIYVQHITGEGAHFISRSSTTTYTYTVDPKKCSNISQNGTYMATSSMQPTTLSIFRYDNQQMILQMPWSTNWKPCDLYWISDTVLSISDPTSSTKHYHIDIPSGQITIDDPPPYVEPTYPQLPNWMSQNPVLFSPDGSKVLYEECPSNLVIINSDGIYCRQYPDWVIYDTVAQLNKVHITDINGSSYQAYGFFAAAAWSPNGRYLAYLQEHNFPLRIFDTKTNQYLDTSDGMASIPVDERKGLYWSPDGTKVAMWAVGRMAEPEPGDDERTLRQLVFFDTTKTDSTNYMLPDRVDNLATVTYQPGAWSPDSQAFAYVNAENSLIYVTASSGVTSVLNNNVLFIITWKAYTPPPPTYTPANTATRTSTPTAVHALFSTFSTSIQGHIS
ncbi:MAG: hypothetical protein H0X30_09685 [Anaerolineae bacterium]|nr:hypothetical protein [Anaerolineae bacterium]